MKMKTTYSKNYIIAICSIVYFVSYFSRKDFAAVMVGMLNDGIINEQLGGLIGTGMFIAYGVGQLISGYLGDRVKPKVLIIVGLGTTALCNILMPLVENTSFLVPIWALNGLAQAMLWPPIVRMLAENLDRETYVTASLIVTSAAHISTVVLYLYTPICLSYFDWKTVFFTAGIIALLTIAVFILALKLILPNDKEVIKTAPRDDGKKAEKKESYTRTLARSGVFFVFGAVIMMGFLRDGIESWLPTLYSQAFDKSAEESTLLSVILPIFSILSIAIAKALHKKPLFSNEVRAAMIVFAVAGTLCIPLVFLINTKSHLLQLLALLLAAIICGCMHACNFLFISCLPGRFAAIEKSATTSGFCNAFVYVGAALASYGFAIISKALGWSITIVFWAGAAVIAVILTLFALRSYTKFIEEQ